MKNSDKTNLIENDLDIGLIIRLLLMQSKLIAFFSIFCHSFRDCILHGDSKDL